MSRLLLLLLLLALVALLDGAEHDGGAARAAQAAQVGDFTRPEGARYAEQGGWAWKWYKPCLERLEAAATAGGGQVVFLGDSITMMWGETGRKAWEREMAPRQAVNLGIGGDRTEQVLWRLANMPMAKLRPQVVVLLIGTNNFGPGVTPEMVAAGVSAVVARTREVWPLAAIVLTSILPNQRANDLMMAVNPLIRPLADGKRVHWLDLASRFAYEPGKPNAFLARDALHLSDKGYDLWAALLLPVIDPLLRER